MNPNWIRGLEGLIRSSVDGSMRDMLKQHPVALPPNWRAGLTKRIVGQIVNKIWETERGLCNLRENLAEKDGEKKEI